ncbi:monocarboxylate transporter 10 [Ischnura elegans]|uniref:monocarboxylate transporter 10 n=1 Tax=Ischnura elegans TaxID=197161 RepID=UPI001ED89549|nr:monocarboxylate transporter 10 [Ischnura elegans]XP_046387670.1 monocarboxylate transporter 10 [Ischnura elegans]
MPESANGHAGGLAQEVEEVPMTTNIADAPVEAQGTGDVTLPMNKDMEQSAEKEEDGEANEDDGEQELDDDGSQCGEIEWVVKPPDGGWGWVIVTASFACNFIVDGIIFTFGMFLGHISSAFGAPKSKVALVGSLLSGFYLMAGPFVSALANRFGFRLVTILGAAVGCVAFLISGLFASSVDFLCVTYGVIGGIGFGLIYVPAVITTGFYFEKWRALATGIAVCGSGIGTFLMAPLATWLIDSLGWRGALMIQAGIVLNCAIFGALFRPLKPIPVRVVQDDDDKNESMESPNQSEPVKRRRVVSECSKDGKGRNLPLLQRIKIARDELRMAESSYSVADAHQTHITGASGNYINNISHDHLAVDNNNKQINPPYHQERKLSSHSVNVARVLLENEGGTVLEELTEEERGEDASLVVNQRKATVLVSCSTPHLKAVVEERVSGSARADKRGGSAMALYRPGARRRNSRVRTTSESGWSFSGEAGKKGSISTGANATSGAQENEPRPFDRSDIFFSASLMRLPQYTSQNSLGYHASVTKLPTKEDDTALEDGPGNGVVTPKWKAVPEEDGGDVEKKSCFSLICPAPALRTLSTMLDVSLLKSPTFIVLAVSGFLTMMGFFVPFMFLAERAESLGMEKGTAVLLVSVVGITNTIGRVVCGMVSSFYPKANALLLNNAAVTVAGISTLAAPISSTMGYQFFYSSIFGLSIACFASLRSIIVVDLLGLDKLTNAFGLLLLFQGLAATVGSPIAGSFKEFTGSYDASFYLSGSLILISGVMCYPLAYVNRWEKNKLADAAKESKVGGDGGVPV